jgi:hypothetical protein
VAFDACKETKKAVELVSATSRRLIDLPLLLGVGSILKAMVSIYCWTDRKPADCL